MNEVKKVEVVVEWHKKNGEVVYATLFLGVLLDEFIYCMRISGGNKSAEPKAIQIKTKDLEETTKKSIVNGCEHYIIKVDEMIGYNDPRIEHLELCDYKIDSSQSPFWYKQMINVVSASIMK